MFLFAASRSVGGVASNCQQLALPSPENLRFSTGHTRQKEEKDAKKKKDKQYFQELGREAKVSKDKPSSSIVKNIGIGENSSRRTKAGIDFAAMLKQQPLQ